jgi:predicted transcriptional regulator
MARKKDYYIRLKILSVLRRANKPLWVREIAKIADLSPSTVSYVLDELSLAGIVINHDFARETKGKIKLRLVSLK